MYASLTVLNVTNIWYSNTLSISQIITRITLLTSISLPSYTISTISNITLISIIIITKIMFWYDSIEISLNIIPNSWKSYTKLLPTLTWSSYTSMMNMVYFIRFSTKYWRSGWTSSWMTTIFSFIYPTNTTGLSLFASLIIGCPTTPTWV